MNRLILARYGEIILKGLNRSQFETRLLRNMKERLKSLGKFTIRLSQSRIYVIPPADAGKEYLLEEALKQLRTVFGLVSLSPADEIPSLYDTIRDHVCRLAAEMKEETGVNTFKIDARRGNKAFPMTSPELASALGAAVLQAVPALSVDVHKPELVLYVEVRDTTLVYTRMIPAFGGLPVGTGGKGLLLLSGGIDSPVAGWMMAKRGMILEGIHFFSYPYTSLRAREKVLALAGILSRYAGLYRLHIIPFTAIQEQIRDRCPPDYMTILIRRCMTRIASELADRIHADVLVTGESLGQVASQTIDGLKATDQSVDMSIFRPLIGMDKNEVIRIARDIGTFETSILPYEDCCTLFNSRHPATRPKIAKILSYEGRLDMNSLMENALTGMETIRIISCSHMEEDEVEER
jgi:thiamine biosynthesis protein ThiI